MKHKKSCLAMLLAGGQGSRLYTLTERTAKPAVRFGGKYRIIDFPLSNCVNSGIDTVGVLTQYEPLSLNRYLGNGEPWGLDRSDGGVTVLPPYQGKQGSGFYRGTADAVRCNLPFLERYDPDDVLILSGDHVYRMDYGEMLAFHRAKGADCTVASIAVDEKDANRFGILECEDGGRILTFEEKPEHPRSNTASMGIYLFSSTVLREELLRDEEDENSRHDFARDIIPHLLNSGKRVYSYRFCGYWKDVGTVRSLWEANMDLLGERAAFSLHDGAKIRTRTYDDPPLLVGKSGEAYDSLVSEGAVIYGRVEHSVLSSGVVVEAGAVVRDSVLMRDVRVGKNARVSRAIVDSETVIGADSVVGCPCGGGLGEVTLVGEELEIECGTLIEEGEMADREWLDAYREGQKTGVAR